MTSHRYINSADQKNQPIRSHGLGTHHINVSSALTCCSSRLISVRYAAHSMSPTSRYRTKTEPSTCVYNNTLTEDMRTHTRAHTHEKRNMQPENIYIRTRWMLNNNSTNPSTAHTHTHTHTHAAREHLHQNKTDAK